MMKKTALLVVALLALGTSVNAQYYYYNTTPWDGNKAYSLNVGTNFNITPLNLGDNIDGLKVLPGLSASFRYEGDKNINERLSWGYQVEFTYLNRLFDYSENKLEEINNVPNVPVTEHSHITWWDGQFDIRFSFSYWFNDYFELQAAAGVYASPIFGIKGERYQTLQGTDTEIPNSREDAKAMSINFDMGISTLVQGKYFFNENFFVSLSLRDNIAMNFFGKDSPFEGLARDNGQRGIVMVGAGYKFIK